MRDFGGVRACLGLGVLLLVFGSAACSNSGLQSSMPAGPSGIGRTVSPGPGAMFAVDHTPPPSESDGIYNPCTDQDTTVHIEPIKATWGPSGGFSVIAKVWTDDGFEGQLSNTGSEQTGRGNSGVVSERFTGRATLRNGSGQMLVYQGNFRLLMVNGQTIIDVDGETLRCLGKP